MSDLVKNNYKVIVSIIIGICLLPLVPVVVEMLLKFGASIGTWIRLFGTNGMCF